jgi:hypothetical protein
VEDRDKLIDKHPDLRGDKQALRTSTSTTLRRREPTNPFIASKLPNMVFDHSRQMNIWPDQRPSALIETTQKETTKTYRTINRSGRPFALNVEVGGSPDDRGQPFIKGRNKGMFK